jgi:histidyl-tRNA synthetase
VISLNPSGQPRLKKVAAFDLLTTTEMGIFAESEAIGAAIGCFSELQSSSSLEEFVLVLNHMDLVETIFASFGSEISELDMMQLRKLLKDERPAKWNQYSIYSNYGISRKLFDSISAFDFEDTVNSAFEKLRLLLPTARPLEHFYQHLKRLEAQLRASGVQTTIILSPLFIPSSFKYFQGGLVFKVVRRSRKTNVSLISGGRYDGLMRSLQYPGKRLNFPVAVGFSIDVELLEQQLLESSGASHRVDIFLVALGAWSDGAVEVIELVSTLRSNGFVGIFISFTLSYCSLSVDFMISESATEDLGRITSNISCKTVVTVKKRALTQGMSVRVRSLHSKKEVEVSSLVLVEYLRNELGQETARNKSAEVTASVVAQDAGTIFLFVKIAVTSRTFEHLSNRCTSTQLVEIEVEKEAYSDYTR